MEPTVYFVIPCYNEEAVLPETCSRLTEKLDSMREKALIGPGSRILFVDDGSKDKTWELIAQYNRENPWVEGVKLAHNRGHQNALLCGLMTAMPLCDCAISMDADLQDDIDALDQFVTKFREGCDVVYGVRNKRETDTWFKRTTAEGFYKVMKTLGVDVVFNHADYRLMSKRALEGLSEYREVNLFLRGIVPLIGYRSDYVYYDRHERFAGESKYPLKKMLSFALDGITSFSVKPLKLISNLGILISALSVFGLLYALISYFAGVTVSGWTAIVCSIWLLGGLQMLCLGVVGGYIGKIYSEVKARPRFRVGTYLQNTQEKSRPRNSARGTIAKGLFFHPYQLRHSRKSGTVFRQFSMASTSGRAGIAPVLVAQVEPAALAKSRKSPNSSGES